MLKCVAFLRWLLLVALLILYETVEAVNHDRDRVIQTYNTDTDQCSALTPTSSPEARESADKACEQSFEALDNIEENDCKGWTLAKCRQLEDGQKELCSCGFTPEEAQKRGIRFSSFRYCAQDITHKQYYTRKKPKPSLNFPRVPKKSAKRKSGPGSTSQTARKPSDSRDAPFNRKSLLGKKKEETDVESSFLGRPPSIAPRPKSGSKSAGNSPTRDEPPRQHETPTRAVPDPICIECPLCGKLLDSERHYRSHQMSHE